VGVAPGVLVQVVGHNPVREHVLERSAELAEIAVHTGDPVSWSGHHRTLTLPTIYFLGTGPQ